ncbi:hypothetical protein [Halorubrum salinum]|uniref:hypothetical protein n=1 Tax=Halorubrum salinum TaxID=767517 RepID=UPI002113250D|nr:hypothetical protein [Halorubrum salinum]
MQRRSLLQALGVGGAASVAGCADSSTVEQSGGPNTTEQTEGGVSIDGLSDEQLHEAYLSDSLAEFGILTWTRKEQIRVYDESEDDVAFVDAENGWFLEVSLTVYNAGGDVMSVPGRDRFSLYHDGEEHTRITQLPSDEFGFEDTRESYIGFSIDPGSWYVTSETEADTSAQVNLLFDVGSEPIEWAINVTDALESPPEQDQYVYYAE